MMRWWFICAGLLAVLGLPGAACKHTPSAECMACDSAQTAGRDECRALTSECEDTAGFFASVCDRSDGECNGGVLRAHADCMRQACADEEWAASAAASDECRAHCEVEQGICRANADTAWHDCNFDKACQDAALKQMNACGDAWVACGHDCA